MKTSTKRATVYFDSEIHQALRIKAAQADKSVSDLVNDAVRYSLAEDTADLAAFEERKREKSLSFEDALKKLRACDKGPLLAFIGRKGLCCTPHLLRQTPVPSARAQAEGLQFPLYQARTQNLTCVTGS